MRPETENEKMLLKKMALFLKERSMDMLSQGCTSMVFLDNDDIETFLIPGFLDDRDDVLGTFPAYARYVLWDKFGLKVTVNPEGDSGFAINLGTMGEEPIYEKKNLPFLRAGQVWELPPVLDSISGPKLVILEQDLSLSSANHLALQLQEVEVGLLDGEGKEVFYQTTFPYVGILEGKRRIDLEVHKDYQ